MSDFFIYLVSSLPMLHFGARPPMTYEGFLGLCEGKLDPQEAELLESLPEPISLKEGVSVLTQPTLKGWLAFDVTLRNELVKIRASRKKTDAQKFLRPDGYAQPSVTHLALAALRNPSLLEGEKMLDAERWRFLDELALGHYFDMDILVIYALKLLILERWDRINAADKPKLLEETIHVS
ncbi:MAG: DUF2764 family protein [Candidatus Omnitrophota bacterium]